MKILYLECGMGAAGDMLTAALSDLLDSPEAFVEQMNALGIPGMHMARATKTSCGVCGAHISVKIGDEEEISDDVPLHEHTYEHEHDHAHDHDHAHEHEHEHDHAHDHEHAHAGMAEVRHIVESLPLDEAVRRDVLGVYALIAEAEAYAHGSDAEKVHFHEVGMMDAVTDISAVCQLMHMLSPDRVIASPVRTGFGQVRCMHGIVPVPAPATAYLLRGMPVYAGDLRGEMLTPTGAALLKYYVDEFAPMPEMCIRRIGCGLGMKEFAACNCLRTFLGESEATLDDDAVTEVSCNLDDSTGEEIGYALKLLLEAGALDVYTEAIQMKKNRPGVKLNCLCRPEQAQQMADIMLRHTATIGVRFANMQRRVLKRHEETVETPYGPVDIKVSEGEDYTKCKAEYASLCRCAEAHGITLRQAAQAAGQAYAKRGE